MVEKRGKEAGLREKEGKQAGLGEKGGKQVGQRPQQEILLQESFCKGPLV